jgi:hypothetical protein
MKEKELNNLLRNKARQLGLCDQWYKDWGDNETMQQLLEKYLRGIDFCIKHDYPNLDFARKVFPRDILIANGIFLDSHVDADNLMRSVVIGNSIGVLRYSGNRTGNIYVRHSSEVTIEVKGDSKVFIEAYDHCIVRVVCDKDSKAFVYWHGGSVYSEGNVTIRDKRSAGK